MKKIMSFFIVVLLIVFLYPTYTRAYNVHKSHKNDYNYFQMTFKDFEKGMKNNHRSNKYLFGLMDVYSEKYSEFFNKNSIANDNISEGKYKILEINENGESEYASSLEDITELFEILNNLRRNSGLELDPIFYSISEFSIDTMSIKEFNLSRDQISGVYDSIIFGSGDYNPAQTCNGDKCSYLNDITEYKADIIINEFVNQGLSVFIDEDVLEYNNSVFHSAFNNLYNSHENVYLISEGFYNYVCDFNDSIDKDYIFQHLLPMLILTANNSNLPKYVVDDSPANYSTVSVGHALDFGIKMTDDDIGLVSLYIDYNRNGKFDVEEVQYQNNINSDKLDFRVILNNTYTGLLDWQIKVESNGYESIDQGTVKVKGEKPVINVVQITNSRFMTGESRSFINQLGNYLNSRNEYEINLEIVHVDDFKNNNASQPHSYVNILENKDVLILGFDIYNEHLGNSMNSIVEWIDSDKPVIFTHGVANKTQWRNVYSDYLGITDKHANFTSDVRNTKDVNKVSSSHYTNYPFVLDTNPSYGKMNKGANQNYQLDISNPDVNVYYTIDHQGNKFHGTHTYDAYNQSYYYSVDNVVYLGLGYNPNEKFKEFSKEILINAIVNSFLTNYSSDLIVEDNDFDITITNKPSELLFEDSIFNFNLLVTGAQTEDYTYEILLSDTQINTGNIDEGVSSTVNIDLSNYSLDLLDNSVKVITIKVVVSDGVSEKVSTFDIVVSNITEIIEQDIITLYEGETFEDINYLIDSQLLSNLEWGLNSANATVEDGVIKAIKPGYAILFVRLTINDIIVEEDFIAVKVKEKLTEQEVNAIEDQHSLFIDGTPLDLNELFKFEEYDDVSILVTEADINAYDNDGNTIQFALMNGEIIAEEVGTLEVTVTVLQTHSENGTIIGSFQKTIIISTLEKTNPEEDKDDNLY